MEVVVLRVRDESASGTVAAVGRATVRYKEKHSVRIAVDNALDRLVFVFAHRIQQFLRRSFVLGSLRYNLPPDWVVRVVRIN